MLLLLALPGAARAQMGIVSVVPASGEAGTQLTVTITGGPDCVFGTNSQVGFFPAATISHGEITPIEHNVIAVALTIPADATPGLQRVSVLTTGGVTACVGEDAFEVTGGASASLLSVTPDHGASGTQVTVEVLGEGTHFGASSVLSFSGGGIQVTSRSAVSETVLQAVLEIDPAAAEGPRDATVSTDDEIATGDGLFRVERAPLLVSPETGAQGALLAAVSLSGGGLDMTTVTSVSLGPDIQVGGFAATDANTLGLSQVSISADAVVGLVDVVLGVAGAQRTFTDAFGVTQGATTALLQVTPARADRGHPGLAIEFLGEHTHFDGGEVVAGLTGTGDAMVGLMATDATHLSGSLVLADDAAEGVRGWTVAVNTGRCTWAAPVVPCESVSLPDAFTVSAAGTIQSVAPALVEAGADVEVIVTGVDAAFAAGQTSLRFEPPEGIEVLSISVTSDSQLTASLRVAAEAEGTLRALRAVTGPDVALGVDVLDVHHPAVRRVIPSAIPAGTLNMTVHVECVDLPLDASAQVSLSGEGITVGAVSFDPEAPDRVSVVLDVAETAPIGPRDVRVTAGGITAVGEGALSVTRATPQDDGGCASAGGPAGAGLWSVLLLAYRRRRSLSRR